MAAAPKWALAIVDRVSDAAGIDAPELTWRRRHVRPNRVERMDGTTSSSGRYMGGEHRIIVSAGTDRTDQRMVLLHELAHAMTPSHHHDPIFWRAAWGLYKRFGLTSYALKREARYRAAATDVAVEIGIRGAKAAAKSAATSRANRQPRGVCPMPEEQAARHGYGTPHTHYVGTVHRWTEPDGSYVDYWTPRR